MKKFVHNLNYFVKKNKHKIAIKSKKLAIFAA